MSTFDLVDCAVNDGPHCDCFMAERETCCYCGETPPADDDEGEL